MLYVFMKWEKTSPHNLYTASDPISRPKTHMIKARAKVRLCKIKVETMHIPVLNTISDLQKN